MHSKLKTQLKHRKTPFVWSNNYLQQKVEGQKHQISKTGSHEVAMKKLIKQMKTNKAVNDVPSFCIIALQISYLLTIYKYIPNLFTLSNLVLGLLSIALAVSGYIDLASYCILLAALLDFCDGFFARLLDASSEIGKQLDSLADLVSFGVAPAFIVFHLYVNFEKSLLISDYLVLLIESENTNLMPFIVFLITVFSAIRLARFNTQKISNSFAGLPTPANALFYISLPLAQKFQHDSVITQFILQEEVLTTAIVLLSWMMISKIEFIALKFTSFNWSSNQWRYVFLGASLLLLLIFHFVAIPIILILYFITSLVNTIKK